jgi:hypothetical protein
MAGFTLGGDTAWRVRAKGDMVAAFHWIKGEPAVVLYPRYRRIQVGPARKSTPYCLPLQSAHEIVAAGSRGEKINAHALVEKATKCAEVTGMGEDIGTIKRIADLLMECLDDLCDMPPEPKRLKEKVVPVGDIALQANGKTVFEGEA